MNGDLLIAGVIFMGILGYLLITTKPSIFSTNTLTATILTDAHHLFELDWLAGSSEGVNEGQATFWMDGLKQATLTNIANDSYRVKSVRLGLPYMVGSTTTSSAFYFDAFKSRRITYIGP